MKLNKDMVKKQDDFIEHYSKDYMFSNEEINNKVLSMRTMNYEDLAWDMLCLEKRLKWYEDNDEPIPEVINYLTTQMIQ